MKNQAYRTKDLSISAVLLIKKIKLVGTERLGGICWFIFTEKARCEDLSNQYLFGEVLVNAREYEEMIKRLKNIIFSKILV